MENRGLPPPLALSLSGRPVENRGLPLALGSHPTMSLPAPSYCFRGQPAVERLEWVMGRGVPSGCKASLLSAVKLFL